MLVKPDIHLRPAPGEGIYAFLKAMVSHWQFVIDLHDFIQDENLLKASVIARDDSIALWNRWVLKMMALDRYWFRLHLEKELTTDVIDARTNKLFPAGSQVWATCHCQAILAHQVNRKTRLLDPSGDKMVEIEQEYVELQCALASPSTKVKFLPVPSFPIISLMAKDQTY